MQMRVAGLASACARFAGVYAPSLAVVLGSVLTLLTMTLPASASPQKFASLLIDVTSGQVLHSANADLPRYPASLTKMMTLYLAFEALDEGRILLDQPLWVSAHAAEQAPTKLGLRAGQTITVENAMLALITKSANDAAAVLAEHLGGSEGDFALRMTGKAHALGMSRTTFRNASGLPDPYQVTTARDMGTLALALLYHYPHYYHYFSTKFFYFGGRSHPNHNHMLGVYDGVDGIKTGYTRASGFNLVASVQRANRRLIGVVLGAPSSTVRNSLMSDMFDEAFVSDGEVEVASIDRYLTTGTTSPATLRDEIAAVREQVGYAAPNTALTRAALRSDRRRSVAAERGRTKVACTGRSRKSCIVSAKRSVTASTRARSTATRPTRKLAVTTAAKTSKNKDRVLVAAAPRRAKSTANARAVKPSSVVKATPAPKKVKAAARPLPVQTAARKPQNRRG
jgi:D-alanyl-D-alanine carboxypeptidase